MYNEEQKVRELAYDLWDQAGRPDGTAEEFWFAAKERLAEQDSQPEPASAPKIAAEAPQIAAAPRALSAAAPQAPVKAREPARKAR